MIYVYQEAENKYQVTEEKLEGTAPVLVLRWSELPKNNIRPWKHLRNTRKDYYKSGVLDYLRSHESSEEAPTEEVLTFVYKDEVESVLSDYKCILELFKGLELIEKIPSLVYNRNIVYGCDIKNYLEDVLGKDLLTRCDDFMEMDRHKKDIIQGLVGIKTDEEKIKYLENKEVDNYVYQFLPPWLKVSYQVLGEGHKTIRRSYIPSIEYNSSEGS